MSENNTENITAAANTTCNADTEVSKPVCDVPYGKIVVTRKTGEDSAFFELIHDSYTFGR